MEIYWKLRGKLREEFMIPGQGQGRALPTTRILFDRPDARWAHWSDSTTFLGWYLAAMALENRLLADTESEFARTRPTDLPPVSEELALALRVLPRLEKEAATAFVEDKAGCPLTAPQPGFFIRDDVPDDDKQILKRLRVVKIQSDFSAPYDDNPNKKMNPYFNKEMSQDQVAHLLMGLALIRKYAKNILVDSRPAEDLAGECAIAMIKWTGKYEWLIKNPNCTKSGKPRNVHRGASSGWISRGLTEALPYFGRDHRISSPVRWYNELIWKYLLPCRRFPLYWNADDLHISMVVATTAKGWGASTFGNLMKLAKNQDWYAYPLLFTVLHGSADIPDWESGRRRLLKACSEILYDSPPIDGTGSIAPPGWKSSHRFLRNKEQQINGENRPQGWTFLHNGLDYLVLHNAYHLLTRTTAKS